MKYSCINNIPVELSGHYYISDYEDVYFTPYQN